MDVNYLMVVVMVVIEALAFGLGGFFKAWIESKLPWDWMKFISTVIYSLIIAVVVIQSGVIDLTKVSDWSAILTPLWIQYMTLYTLIYAGLMYFFTRIVVPVAQNVSQKTIFYPKKEGVDPNRKMDQETRTKFFNDQPEQIRAGILRAVDAAEAKQTWRYAIEAGAWIYLVEFGEVFGAKHYYFRGWFGSQVVFWKACCMECFETIRTTAKFPEFGDLY